MHNCMLPNRNLSRKRPGCLNMENPEVGNGRLHEHGRVDGGVYERSAFIKGAIWQIETRAATNYF